MSRTRIAHAAWMLAAVAAALAFAAPARAAFAPGSAGLGDPFFPFAGNGGYDVGHYALTLSYDPATKVLDGRALIMARATQDLSRFNLDLRGFTVSGVTVDGRAGSFVRDGQELIVTPAQPLRDGSTFAVDVTYAGPAAGDHGPRRLDRGLGPDRRRRVRGRRAAGLARLVPGQRQPRETRRPTTSQ